MPDPSSRVPAGLRTIVALAITALVVALALWVNDGATAPRWITGRLIPVLGWIYLALAAYALGYWLWRKWRGPTGGDGGGKAP